MTVLAVKVVPPSRWQCAGKRRYTNVERAQEAMLRLSEDIARGITPRRPGMLNVFACPDCGFWHIGHTWTYADGRTYRPRSY